MHLNHRLQKYKIKIHIQINLNKINIIQTKGIYGENKKVMVIRLQVTSTYIEKGKISFVHQYKHASHNILAITISKFITIFFLVVFRYNYINYILKILFNQIIMFESYYFYFI